MKLGLMAASRSLVRNLNNVESAWLWKPARCELEVENEEATWGGDAMTPEIDWRMSASLQNVHRRDTDLAEVTNLRSAVRAWQHLDPERQSAATLTPEHAIQIDGVSTSSFNGAAIAKLAEHLRLGDSGAVDDPVAA